MKLFISLVLILFMCFCSSGQRQVAAGDLINYDANSEIWQRRLEQNYFKFYHTDYGPSLVRTIELDLPLVSSAIPKPTSVVFLLQVDAEGRYTSTVIKAAALPYQKLCEQELQKVKIRPASMAQNKLSSFVYLILHFKLANQ